MPSTFFVFRSVKIPVESENSVEWNLIYKISVKETQLHCFKSGLTLHDSVTAVSLAVNV